MPNITLPLSHRSGLAATVIGLADGTGWALPGGQIVRTRHEATRRGMAIFRAAGWRPLRKKS